MPPMRRSIHTVLENRQYQTVCHISYSALTRLVHQVWHCPVHVPLPGPFLTLNQSCMQEEHSSVFIFVAGKCARKAIAHARSECTG